MEASHPGFSPSCVAREEDRGLPWNAVAWIPVDLGAGWILVSPMVSNLELIDERAIALEQSISLY